jgi:hypothetical protein
VFEVTPEEEGYPGKEARAELAELRKIAVHSGDEGTHFYYKDAWESDQGLLAEKDALIEQLTAALDGKYDGDENPWMDLIYDVAQACEHGASKDEIEWAATAGRRIVNEWYPVAVAALSGTPTTAKLVPVERLREIDIALRHGHECAQEDLQLTIDYVGSLLREEKT